MRIAHFIPCNRGDMTDATAESAVQTALWIERNGHTRIRLQAHDPWIHMARNRALSQAIAMECDLLLMQDADVSFADDVPALELLMRTIDVHSCAAVGAAVRIRARATRIAASDFRTRKAYAVDYVGTGLMLIDVALAAAVEPPWFGVDLNNSGTGVIADEGPTFCRKLQAAGHTVFCNFTFPTRHHGRRILDTEPLIKGTNRERRASAQPTQTLSGNAADGDDCHKSEG